MYTRCDEEYSWTKCIQNVKLMLLIVKEDKNLWSDKCLTMNC